MEAVVPGPTEKTGILMGYNSPSPCYCEFVRELQRVRDNVVVRRGDRGAEAGRRLDAVITQMLQDGCPINGAENCAEQCQQIPEAPGGLSHSATGALAGDFGPPLPLTQAGAAR